MNERAVRAALMLGFAFAASASAIPTVYPTGVTIHEPGVTPGNVLFKTFAEELGGHVAVLVDLDGEVVHSWVAPYEGTALGYTRPLPDGHVLAELDTDGGPSAVVEMDWFGNVVWEFGAVGMRFHHDHSRIPGGHTVILCSRDLLVPEISDQEITDDCILVVDADQRPVWFWQTADHYDEFGFSDDVKAKIFDHAGDWAHANAVSVIPPNPSMTDPRFRPGNFVISYRFINSIAIVDSQTGEIVWRTDGLTIGQHDSEMLRVGLPGAGRILAFDNGIGGHYNDGGKEVSRSYSRIVEIDPFDQSVPWEYTAEDSGLPLWSFDSYFISSVQRLANGNTLIDEGANGRIFEITRDGAIVWEYVSPYWFDDPRQGWVNKVYRAEKVGPDWGLVRTD